MTGGTRSVPKDNQYETAYGESNGHVNDESTMPYRFHSDNLAYSFYRAMHFSAKRGIAIACRLSVRLSVRL